MTSPADSSLYRPPRRGRWTIDRADDGRAVRLAYHASAPRQGRHWCDELLIRLPDNHRTGTPNPRLDAEAFDEIVRLVEADAAPPPPPDQRAPGQRMLDEIERFLAVEPDDLQGRESSDAEVDAALALELAAHALRRVYTGSDDG